MLINKKFKRNGPNVYKVVSENKSTGFVETSYLDSTTEEDLTTILQSCYKGTKMIIKSIEYIKPEDYLKVMGPVRSKKYTEAIS